MGGGGDGRMVRILIRGGTGETWIGQLLAQELKRLFELGELRQKA